MNPGENIENYEFSYLKLHLDNLCAVEDLVNQHFQKDLLLENNEWQGIVSETQEMLVQKYFIGNALNYSFWFERYDDKYQYNNLTGSEAMWDVVERNPELLSAEFIANIDEEAFRMFFGRMPLEDWRIKSLNEAGNVLLGKFDGKAINILRKSQFNIQTMIELITSEFEFWNDYNGEICFYKRIQAFINCLLNDSHCGGLLKKNDIHQMTILADYHVPKLFRYYRVFEYVKELDDKISNGEFLKSGSKEELDIRVATIVAGRKLLDMMNKEQKKITATTLDGILWSEARKINSPYHLCKSIWY